jgi:hypothetical protein
MAEIKSLKLKMQNGNRARPARHFEFYTFHFELRRGARVTTADVEQTTVAAFRPWRGS